MMTYSLVNIASLQTSLVGAREVLVGDDIKHPKCLLLVHKQQKHSRPEVQALTIADSGDVDSKSSKNSTQTLHDRSLNDLRVRLLVLGEPSTRRKWKLLLWLKVNVVRMGSVKIPLNELWSFRVCWNTLSNKFLVQTRILIQVLLPISIEEPGISTPLWRNPFPDKSLD